MLIINKMVSEDTFHFHYLLESEKMSHFKFDTVGAAVGNEKESQGS